MKGLLKVLAGGAMGGLGVMLARTVTIPKVASWGWIQKLNPKAQVFIGDALVGLHAVPGYVLGAWLVGGITKAEAASVVNPAK